MKKRRDLRIMWSSNGIWTNSGYGVFSRDIICRMVEDGWITGHIAWWGADGHHFEMELGQFHKRFEGLKVKVYPRMADIWGADAIVHHSKDFKADVVFTMQDIWALNPQFLSQIKHWIPYTPIDKYPAPDLVCDKLQFAYRAITFSQFGHDALNEAGWASTLILEGTDTSIFKPQDKVEARKKIGLPQDIFLFGMIAANKENPPRKGYQEALEAFARFVKKHPEARLFIHSQQQSPTGFPVKSFASHLEIADKIIYLDDYKAVYGANSYFIADEMNCFDVLLHPSQTEGFGLTPVEAASCGIPAIVGNNTSQPEMIIEGKTGWIAKCNGKRFTADNSYVEVVDPDDLYKKMELAYEALKKDPKKIAKDCREHIIKNYSIDTIYKEKWQPLLLKLQDEILGEKKDLTSEKKGIV